jgi:hypothetical protein
MLYKIIVSNVTGITFILQTILQKFLIKIKGTDVYKVNYSFKQTKYVAAVHCPCSFIRLLLPSSPPSI